MAERVAACACGEITLTVSADPWAQFMCHCEQCQRRTGSTYSVHAYFEKSQVSIKGVARKYSRSSDAGRMVDFYFCTACGSTAYWHPELWPDRIGIPVGLFADPTFPPPKVSTYSSGRHLWVSIPEDVTRR
jgi:hypothetical protein